MNLNFNKVVLLGRIASDITYKDEPNKDKVSVLFLATNRKWKDRDGIKKEQATFHKVLFFGAIADTIHELGSKGEIIMVEGRLQHKDIFDEKTNSYKKDVAIICERFQLGTENFKEEEVIAKKIDISKLDDWNFDDI